MKTTATVELPTIVVSAIKEYSTTGKLLWRIGEGLDHVKIELTYKLPDDQSTGIVGQAKNKPFNVESVRGKKAKRRSKPAPSADEWPRQSLPAEKPPGTPAKPKRQQPQRSCKTPQREIPPPPTEPCPETLPPKVAAGRVGTQPPPATQQCKPPTTVTVTTPPPAKILKPILKKTAPAPPPSPPLQLGTPEASPTQTSAKLDNHNVLSELPGKHTEYNFYPAGPSTRGTYDPPIRIEDDFEITAIPKQQGRLYFLLHSKKPGVYGNYFARYDRPSDVFMVAVPKEHKHDDGRYSDTWQYWKKIYYHHGTPVEKTDALITVCKPKEFCYVYRGPV